MGYGLEMAIWPTHDISPKWHGHGLRATVVPPLRAAIRVQLGVQIDYDVVHLRTSLVQLFVLLQLNFE
jgi:hypothetical protein